MGRKETTQDQRVKEKENKPGKGANLPKKQDFQVVCMNGKTERPRDKTSMWLYEW